MKKLRKILKRINGQKRALNIQKRAPNIRRGVRRHPTQPLRYATMSMECLVHILIASENNEEGRFGKALPSEASSSLK